MNSLFGILGTIAGFIQFGITFFVLLELKGLIRFQIIKEIQSYKKYRQCKITYENFYEDLLEEKIDIKFSDRI